jgi:hypothetical protein
LLLPAATGWILEVSVLHTSGEATEYRKRLRRAENSGAAPLKAVSPAFAPHAVASRAVADVTAGEWLRYKGPLALFRQRRVTRAGKSGFHHQNM